MYIEGILTAQDALLHNAIIRIGFLKITLQRHPRSRSAINLLTGLKELLAMRYTRYRLYFPDWWLRMQLGLQENQ